jgi:hypothetical protein
LNKQIEFCREALAVLNASKVNIMIEIRKKIEAETKQRQSSSAKTVAAFFAMLEFICFPYKLADALSLLISSGGT